MRPNTHPRAILDPTILREAARDREGPVHIVQPDILRDEIAELKSVFAALDLPAQIFLAHKATKSAALIKTARAEGIQIDVSSAGELESALRAGFPSESISCTGPKSERFLSLALEKGCTISIDSISELRYVAKAEKRTPILLRIEDLPVKGIKDLPSRYGIATRLLDRAYEIIEHSHLEFRGFHTHRYGYSPEMRARRLRALLTLVANAHKRGHHTRILNIGGAFSHRQLAEPKEWTAYIDTIAEQIISGEDLEIWGDPYGLRLDANGTVQGRDRAHRMIGWKPLKDQIAEILTADQSVLRDLRDSMITLAIEPGRAILARCGHTITKVIATKRTSCDAPFAIVNANIMNLSLRMIEYVSDPLLITDNPTGNPYRCYLAGNLCREDDILMQRKLTFPTTPAPGDLIVFPNTGAYHQHYEDAAPQMQPAGTTLAYAQRLMEDDAYEP